MGKQEIIFPSVPSNVTVEIPYSTREDSERPLWIIETQANAPIHEREIERKVWMELCPDKLRLTAERRFKRSTHFNEAKGDKNFTGA